MDMPEDLVGGVPGIDFSNCVSHIEKRNYVERYRFLLAWSRRSRLLLPEEARGLAREAERRPGVVEEVTTRALDLARATRRLLGAAAEEGGHLPGDLAVLNRELSLALPRLCLEDNGTGLRWNWDANDSDLDRLLWPVARSAAELLVSEDLCRVKVCASDTCTWLFLDTSRNRRRRWCDMSVCGNREKARRHRVSNRRRRAP